MGAMLAISLCRDSYLSFWLSYWWGAKTEAIHGNHRTCSIDWPWQVLSVFARLTKAHSQPQKLPKKTDHEQMQDLALSKRIQQVSTSCAHISITYLQLEIRVVFSACCAKNDWFIWEGSKTAWPKQWNINHQKAGLSKLRQTVVSCITCLMPSL